MISHKLYFLKDPESKEIRYVGITKKKLYKRLSEHIGKSKKASCHRHHWINSLSRRNLKPLIELFLESQSREFIVSCEIFLIKELRELGFCLVNSTSGGEDNSGSSNPMFGRKNSWGKHSDKAKKILSEKLKGRNCFWIEGNKHPMKNPEVLEKVCKRVKQLDFNNNIVNIFSSTREAERFTGIDHSSISKCCRGKLKQVKGFNWEFLND